MKMFQYILWISLTWLSLTETKPLRDDGAIQNLIRENMSETLREKADAIDNLLHLLSEIDLPSICDALSAQKTGGNDKMATVDAILAEAAKSQAMTLIPTNFPEASKVTRPGIAPLNFSRFNKIVRQQRGGKPVNRHQDGKQASQEVAISKLEGKMDPLSLDIAVALSGKEQVNSKSKGIKNIDVSIDSFSGIKRPDFPHYRQMRPTSSTEAPSYQSTTTVVTKAIKKDTTIPTLANDLMLHDDVVSESGDGETTQSKVQTTESYTTIRMEDESEENKIGNSLNFKFKNIFKNHDRAYELKKGSSLQIPNSTPRSGSLKVPSSVYKTFVPDVRNEISFEHYEDTTDIVPTVDEDLGWGFTLPTNTTFGEFMFGNITLNQSLSDELASILNSTVPVDFLISNDTIYNEFMSILNETMEGDEVRKKAPDFDMGLSETGDYKNLIDYISNMTEKLASEATGMNNTAENSTQTKNLTFPLEINANTSLIDDLKNSSLEADYSTYSAKILDTSETKTLTTERKVTDSFQRNYVQTKFPAYPPRRGDEEIKGHTISLHTKFAAGDYYPDEKDNDVNIINGPNDFINHDDLKSKFKHSGFAPLNHNQKYKVNARHSGLTYLGFDFKNMKRNPFIPKIHHDARAINTLTNQKTIWSEEPKEKQSAYPTGYTCPGLFGYYGDAHDCKAFFICSWGVPYRFHCPPGTIWSTEESVCNWSRDVTCHETI